MNAFNLRGLAFALKCTLAALLAIFIAMSLNFANAGWAGLTVFLTSQPLAAASGALVARSLYRVAGTVAGVVASLVIIPGLIDAPEFMVLGVATWVGLCLYASLLDRTPRGYAVMLAGYTVALVGMPLANDPGSIFDTAVLRAEEVAIGAVCAIAVHTLFLPQSVGALFFAKLTSMIEDTRSWIERGLSTELTVEAERTARHKLAVDLTEFRTLAANLRFEVEVDKREIELILTLEDRMVALLPLISGVEDRLAAMAKAEHPIPPAIMTHLAAVRVHIAGAPDSARTIELAEAGRDLALSATSNVAQQVLSVGAMERIAELLVVWNECQCLAARLHGKNVDGERAQTVLVANTPRRSLHIDHGLAAFSGLAAALAVIVSSCICWLANWPQGAFAMGIAGAASGVFAFVDDPRVMIRTLVEWTIIAVPVAAIYVFGVFPFVDGYIELAVVLSPMFFLTGLYLGTPNYWLPALSFALISQSLMSLQPSLGADFVSFSSVAIGAVIGGIVALVVTSLVRVISVQTSVWRLLRASWRDLASLAERTSAGARAVWASQMLDRVGMLIPRLAGANGVAKTKAKQALSELRLGVNIIDLREVAEHASPPLRAAVERLLNCVATHFRVVLKHAEHAPEPGLLEAIDVAIERLIETESIPTRQRGLTAASGLRLGLFPGATAFALRSTDSAR